MPVEDLMRQCNGKAPPSKALVKGLAKELEIDESFLEKLAEEVRKDLGQRPTFTTTCPRKWVRSSLFTSNLGANMKCASILPLAIMLANASMFGQSLMVPPRIDPSKCPVGLEVQQSASLVAYSVPADDVHQRSSQRFDFKMTNLSPHEIVSAEITAHAFSDKLRVFSVPAPTPDLAKTVDAAFEVKGNSSASRELSFAHFPVIWSFDVDSVTYADGSTWHASSPGACSVSPDAIVRIRAQ
jgi:hypothetical protein